MKKALKLFGIIGAISLILVGCTNPINDYVSAVETTKIEAKLDEIDDVVTELADLADLFNEDTAITDEQDINSDEIATYDQAIAKAEELNTLVIDLKASSDTIDTTDEEVSRIHEELVSAVEEYETLANTVIDSTQWMKEIAISSLDAYTTHGELFSLLFSAKPSKDFMAAYEAVLEQYAEEINFILSEELFVMLKTRDIDYEKIFSINQSLKEATSLISMAQVTNDVDKQYKETISAFIESIIVLTNTIIEDEELVIATAEYTTSDLIKEKSDRAKAKVESWKKKLTQ